MSYILLLSDALVITPVVDALPGDLLGLGVELAAAGGHLEALGRRGHGVAVVGEEGGALLLEDALLLLVLLLLQILDLGVDARDGVARGRGGHHLGGHGGRGHGRGVVLEEAVAAGDHVRGVRVGHDGVVLLVLARLGHHGLGGAVLEAVEVELHAVAHVGHAAHVEELVELVIAGSGHVLVLPVPRRGSHHDSVSRGVVCRAVESGMRCDEMGRTAGMSVWPCAEGVCREMESERRRRRRLTSQWRIDDSCVARGAGRRQ